MKVAEQCSHAYIKANKMLGLVKRTVKYRNPAVMTQLYKSLVRPHLEFSSSAWSRHYVKDKVLLERVQHRFTRLFPEMTGLRYEARLEVLRLWTLEERRNRADLSAFFSMLPIAVCDVTLGKKPTAERTQDSTYFLHES